jgi:hypothetical protein
LWTGGVADDVGVEPAQANKGVGSPILRCQRSTGSWLVMVERRINAELRLDNRRRVLVAGAAGLAKSAKEAMFLDPLGRRPRIPGASIGRRPVKTDRGQVDLYEDQSGLLCNFA